MKSLKSSLIEEIVRMTERKRERERVKGSTSTGADNFLVMQTS
jgi:hypothetical protein